MIGNGAYRDVATLANPPNDARDVAAELKTLGFKVTLGVDLDQAGMERVIAEWSRTPPPPPTFLCSTTAAMACRSPRIIFVPIPVDVAAA